MGLSTERGAEAIAVVAKRFSATWEKAEEDSPDAYLTVAGERIAVTVATIEQGGAGEGSLAKPRLRFDKVALKLLGTLRDALRESVPADQTVVLTVTAPIRLPSKTAAAMEEKIRARLAGRSAQGDVIETIHGNQIRVRLVADVSRRASKVIGFVHNPDSDPAVLLRSTQSLLQLVGMAEETRAPETFTGDRWLVIADEHGLPHIETHRHVYSQLAIPTAFQRILMVFAGGRVETLTG